MFALSFKFSAKKAALMGLAIFTVAYATSFALDKFVRGEEVTFAVLDEEGLNLPKVKDNDERITMIEALGWEVMTEPVQIKEIALPESFDEELLEYNELQKSQGLDMEKYLGERAKCYSYLILNYQGTDDEVWLNLIIINDRVVAGDVSSRNLDGFVHGITMPN